MARKPLFFNDLLLKAGVSPREVRLLRHRTEPGLEGQSVHDLWERDLGGFELYQRTQKQNVPLFRTGRYWASFTSPRPGVSLFVGLYQARFVGTSVPDWKCPYRGDQPGGGVPVDVYETDLRPELSEHIGTLTVEWDPKSVRSWRRYAEGAAFPATAGAYAAGRLVASLDELKVNLAHFERLRADQDHPEHSAYLGFIERGHTLLPYTTAASLAFAPSRLVGYRNNTLARHAANGGKDGKETNPTISRILGAPYAKDDRLERAYRKFCGEQGLAPHDRTRRYWPPVHIDTDPLPTAPAPSVFDRQRLYTRQDIADAIGLASTGGNWDTGYARYGGEFFIFANVGSKGRTGHNYANRWDGKRLLWSAKNGARLGQPEITALLSGDYPIHIFWRAAQREAFTYAGLAAPREVEETTPIRIAWNFEERYSAEGGEDCGRPGPRRGPPPVCGPRTAVYHDGPTCVYMLELIGPIEQLFPSLAAGHRVVKVGMSNDPDRRVDELSCGLPPGCTLYWKVVATRLLGSAREAFDVESVLLERLRIRGHILGGEFAALPREEFSQLRDLQ